MDRGAWWDAVHGVAQSQTRLKRLSSTSSIRLLSPWGFFRLEYWSALPCLSPGDLPNPGIKPRSPTLQADSLLAETPGKPKNTGVGSLSLLQGIFPTQELNWGLLHCRPILYQLSYEGSPIPGKEGLTFIIVLFVYYMPP